MAYPPSAERPFGGLLTALVTPFTADGDVDFDAAVELAVKLVDQGNDGLVLNGTTGESPTTHSPEKFELIRQVVAAVGDRAVVVAGACSNDTRHAVRMATQAAEAGADGLLAVSPYYSRPSQEGLYQHFTAIADATDLPVMLYDIPGRTGVRISPALYQRLARHERIVAVKDATGDVSGAAHVRAMTGLAFYSGDDSLYLPFLSIGAVGLVSVVAHVATGQFVAMREAFDRADMAAATAINDSLTPLIDAIMGGGFGVVAIKAALAARGDLPSDALRLPQVPASAAEVEQIRGALRTAGLL